MPIYEFEGKRPVIGSGTFVHPEATIIGEVTIGEKCYIGSGARIRGDWGAIYIGDFSNVQENCVIHVNVGDVARLGSKAHIGHGAVLHTPQLGERVMVGINAIILDHSKIGDGCMIGAGAIVTQGTEIPPGKLVMGIPAKPIKDLSPELQRRMAMGNDFYVGLASRCHESLREVSLEEVML